MVEADGRGGMAARPARGGKPRPAAALRRWRGRDLLAALLACLLLGQWVATATAHARGMARLADSQLVEICTHEGIRILLLDAEGQPIDLAEPMECCALGLGPLAILPQPPTAPANRLSFAVLPEPPRPAGLPPFPPRAPPQQPRAPPTA
ncbi:hypothetical protein [Falsiroseomonas sp.]|uniref:hypothetical protein n=1 Tax=Falsiroseomonas sp. TaxID=2870721 RepID=UPI003F71E356